MFFKRKAKFFDNNDKYLICSLFDRNLKKFYSLVLQKNIPMFFSSLCFTYDKSKDNELLKVNKDNLDLYSLGEFNALNGIITNKIKYIGKFSDLLEDYHKKILNGGKVDGSKCESEKNTDSI